MKMRTKAAGAAVTTLALLGIALPANAATTAYVHSGCQAAVIFTGNDVTSIFGNSNDCRQGLYVSLIDRYGRNRWSRTYNPTPGFSTSVWIPDMHGGRLHVEELNYTSANTVVDAYL